MNISQILQKNIPLLDPHHVSDVSIVSHAHSDHVAFNPYSKRRIIICTKQTAAIIRHRNNEKYLQTIELDYGKKYFLKELIDLKRFNYNDISITLLPSGHVLGSSQILIETDNSSLLYSGDFKLRENSTCDNLIFPKTSVEYLIMESTFGKSKYVFPDFSKIQNDLVEFCNNTIEKNLIPVIFAYSLGKSQEVTKLLENQNFNILQHGSIFNISEIYENFGVNLGQYKKYKKEYFNDFSKDKRIVLITPPQYGKTKMINNIPNRKTAIITGWASDLSYKYIFKTDTGFALSDHADYNELIKYAQTINAKRTLVTHGFALDLARDLNRLGLDAEPYQNKPMGLF